VAAVSGASGKPASTALADALLALHRPWYESRRRRYEHRVLVFPEDVPEGHVCHIGDLDSCSAEEHYIEACVECRQTTEDGDPAFPLWPCPTARLALAAKPDSPPSRDTGSALLATLLLGLLLTGLLSLAFLAGEQRRCESLREQGSALVERYCGTEAGG
jgi:hypothetical protein